MRERRGRYYIFERCILPNETIVAEIPLTVYKNKINDIGISASDNEVCFFVTYSIDPGKCSAIWQVADKNYINKAVRAIKITNNSNRLQNICIRIAF